jgi:hypothetical protein
MAYKPTIILDFDAVIHSYNTKWQAAHIIPDAPVPGAVDAILRYLDAGFNVAIHSSRSKSLRGRWAMKRYLRNAIAEHWYGGGRSKIYDAECECLGDAKAIVDRLKWPWFKPAALITIDDRALTFNGDWSSPEYTPDAIRSFKPWNKL